MEKILFISDNSPKSRKALEFTASLARRLEARLLVGSTYAMQYAGREKIISGNTGGPPTAPSLTKVSEANPSLVTETDISGMDAPQLAQLVNHEGIGMVIKTAECRVSEHLLLNTLLSRILCPLMLIPDNWSLKDLERIVYLADLRYCRTDIVRYLAGLAAACQADLSVAHLTKEGMVHIEESYAHQLFNEHVREKVKYERLRFHYTRERDLIKAADVLTKGLHYDMLVMTKNRYHFNKLVGQSVNDRPPSHIQVPLLIFPG
jgi:hypothetical protein